MIESQLTAMRGKIGNTTKALAMAKKRGVPSALKPKQADAETLLVLRPELTGVSNYKPRTLAQWVAYQLADQVQEPFFFFLHTAVLPA